MRASCAIRESGGGSSAARCRPRRLARGLVRAARPQAAQADTLAAIAGWGEAAVVILAARDATALAYAEAAEGVPATVTLDTASHSFADTANALAEAVIGQLGRLD